MKEFLLGIYIEYGDRAFPYIQAKRTNGEYTFGSALQKYFIERINPFPPTVEPSIYKLTAKALEYIRL